jgi:hypothetical protein
MQNHVRRDGPIHAPVAITLLLLCIAGQTNARAYISESSEGYTVRCSTVRTTTLSQEVQTRYGIQADDHLGLLSCVMQQQGSAADNPENIRGEIRATISTLTGQAEAADFSEVLQGSAVSYLSTYEIPVNGPLTFEVAARPSGLTSDIVISFDDIRPGE